MESPSRVASVSAYLGGVAFVLAAGAPLGIQLGLFGPRAFYAFLLGGLLALLALVTGVVGLWLTRPSAHTPGRERASTGTAFGFVILAMLMLLGGGSRDLPAINDITTNPDDPPVFVHAPSLQDGADMSYPGESFAAQQRAGYPDLATIRLTVPPDRAFQMVDAAAQKLGWEVTYRDPENGILEATQVSRIFEFVDDIVVRIRPEKGLSVIDVRSRSRLGRGDLGANAERIRALQQALSR